ncbi:Mu-like prophage protein gp36 [Burkholderia pseudomallei]|nr:Mu-like prophage protein gp36 [Burkholderia pseudomallei]
MTTTIYLTADEFTARFEDIAAEYDAATISAALDDANGLAVGYVSATYPTLDPVPGLLKAAVADIARRKLFKFDPPNGVAQMYLEAMKTLREIASGALQLRGPVDPVTDTAESLIFCGSNVRVMNAHSLGYWQPDAD